MKSNNQAVAWLAGAWALVLAVGITYYLIHSWKRGVVTPPARLAKDVSREKEPGQYWFAMLVWLVVDLFAIACVSFRIYKFFKPAT